jgi:competence protein ComEA
VSSIKPWQQAVIYILIGMALAAAIFLATRPPLGTPIELTPAAPMNLLIQVDGAVQKPGVYTLPVSSRVQDAIDAAGGSTKDGSTADLNLARPLKDGEKINVSSLSAAPLLSNSPTLQTLLDINTATLDQLDSLPGIGKAKAQAILDYRKEHGSFISLEELQNVPGITVDVFAKIKDLIKVQ